MSLPYCRVSAHVFQRSPRAGHPRHPQLSAAGVFARGIRGPASRVRSRLLHDHQHSLQHSGVWEQPVISLSRKMTTVHFCKHVTEGCNLQLSPDISVSTFLKINFLYHPPDGTFVKPVHFKLLSLRVEWVVVRSVEKVGVGRKTFMVHNLRGSILRDSFSLIVNSSILRAGCGVVNNPRKKSQ